MNLYKFTLEKLEFYELRILDAFEKIELDGLKAITLDANSALIEIYERLSEHVDFGF